MFKSKKGGGEREREGGRKGEGCIFFFFVRGGRGVER